MKHERQTQASANYQCNHLPGASKTSQRYR